MGNRGERESSVSVLVSRKGACWRIIKAEGFNRVIELAKATTEASVEPVKSAGWLKGVRRN
ncbi:unnamed protein product [Linum tenue]|uniref:Uncharacterized protein n=1 Tax=Linum tenue TaxID=586396 RepID=A0AAV0LN24_9ROSI|nr:unnamed protein product [Linum tenue]